MEIDPLERHDGARGWVSEIYSGELGAELQNIHLGSIEPGAVRGNHRHNKSREWIAFLNGRVKVYCAQTDKTEEVIISEPSIVKFEPREEHAIENCGEETVYFTAYRDHLFTEDDPDAEPVEVI